MQLTNEMHAQSPRYSFQRPTPRPQFSPRTYRAVVEIRFESEGEAMFFDGAEIGPNGMFIESDYLLPLGMELWVRFPSPLQDGIVALAQIVDIDSGEMSGKPGMKLSFIELDKQAWRALFVYSNT